MNSNFFQMKLCVLFSLIVCSLSKLESDSPPDKENGYTYLEKRDFTNSDVVNNEIDEMTLSYRNNSGSSKRLGSRITLNPPPIEVDSWVRIRQLVSVPIKVKGLLNFTEETHSMHTGESFFASLTDGNSVEMENSSTAFKDLPFQENMSYFPRKLNGTKTQGRFGCIGGGVCETCSAFAILPDGYAVCCIFCLVHPTIQTISDTDFSCTCQYI